MAKKETKKAQEAQVEEAISTTGQWIINHQNLLEWIVLGIIAVILCVVLLNNYVFKPKALAASNENAKAVVYFNQGNYEKALNGDDADCLGFEEIADKYSLYQQGKLAALYAGICYYELGDMEQAAKFISKFSANDVNVEPAAQMMLGDVYVEMGEYAKAAKALRKAGEEKNDIISPMAWKKLGFVYMEQGDMKAANSVFETIKTQYPQSSEAQDIDKYIELTK